MIRNNHPAIQYNPDDNEERKIINQLMRQSFLQAQKDGETTREYVWELIGHPDIDVLHLVSCKDEAGAKKFASEGLVDGLSIGKLISSRVMKLEDFDE